jgi:transcription elongation factor Elf1
MSPRKSGYRVEEHIVKSYVKEKNRVLKGPYTCIHCGYKKLKILIRSETKEVLLRCGCGFKAKTEYNQKYEAIDYYNKVIDNL